MNSLPFVVWIATLTLVAVVLLHLRLRRHHQVARPEQPRDTGIVAVVPVAVPIFRLGIRVVRLIATPTPCFALHLGTHLVLSFTAPQPFRRPLVGVIGWPQVVASAGK